MNPNLSDELIRERTQTHEVITVKTVADLSAIATNQETQLYQKLEKESPVELSEGVWSCSGLGGRRLASRENISVV